MNRHIQTKLRSTLSKLMLNENISTPSIPPEVLNEILKGYLECALWTEEERLTDEYESEHPDIEKDYDEQDAMDSEMSELDKLVAVQSKMNSKSFDKFIVDDLDVDSKIQAYLDIKTFVKLAGFEAVQEAIDENGTFKLGMDIWFTRNGHGAGFFDHSYQHEEQLSNAGSQLKGVDLFISDNMKLMFSN